MRSRTGPRSGRYFGKRQVSRPGNSLRRHRARSNGDSGLLGESVAPALVGLITGSAAAWMLERFVRASAFGWPSSGIAAVTMVSVALLVVAFLTAAVPARRTMRIDPSVVLRAE
jgi:hypothetical protein